jgi:hypothetical protein
MLQFFLTILPAILRFLLGSLGATLVTKGLLTEGQFEQAVAGLTLSLATLGFIAYRKWKDKLKLDEFAAALKEVKATQNPQEDK